MRALICVVADWSERPKRTNATSRTTATMTAGHFESSPRTMKRPSAIAIATPIETQRSWSQRLVRVLPCSIVGALSWSRNPGIDKTLAGRGQPAASVLGDVLEGALGGVAVVEEAVERRTGSGDPRAEGAELREELRSGIADEVVRRQDGEIAGRANCSDSLLEGGSAGFEALCPSARVERGENGSGGAFAAPSGIQSSTA